MPNIKSAKKRVKTDAKKREANNELKASMRTAIKKVKLSVKEGNKENAISLLNAANKKIDKAVKAGLVHPNKAARNKSNISKKVNEMK